MSWFSFTLLVMRQGQGNKATETVFKEARPNAKLETIFAPSAKKPLHCGVGTSLLYVIGCLPVVCWVLSVVSLTSLSERHVGKPISTKLVSTNANELALTDGTCYVANGLEVATATVLQGVFQAPVFRDLWFVSFHHMAS